MIDRGSETDRGFMEEALRLASRGKGWTSPNPCVGAVVVAGERIVGRGYHHRAGREHAEVIALRTAGKQAAGSTLYVTLEPCSHYGRTPPCVDRIIAAGVGRVVAAMADPNPRIRGRGLRRLRRAGIEVTTGLLRERARRLNEDFVKFVTTGRPFVTLKLALSLDGRIAAKTGDSKWITSRRSRAAAHRLRHEHDAVLVGRRTLIRDDPHLTCRLPRGRPGKHPARVVLATTANVPRTARALSRTSERRFVVCGPLAPRARIRRLEQAGVEVLSVPLHDGRVSVSVALDALAGADVTSILVEGGSTIAASFLEAGCVDKIAFFFAPKIIGGADSVPGIGGAGVDRVADAWNVRDVTLHSLGADWLVTGYL